MPWAIDLVLFLRSLIGDLDATKYTNERLKQVLAIAAFQINSSNFSNNYVVNIARVSITPDPIDLQDQDFCLLTCYKAACIIVGGEVKTMSNQAISYREGPNSLDLVSAAQATKVLYDDLCNKYDEMLTAYEMEKSSEGGHAILGPYSPGSDFVAFFRGQDHRSNNL
jgi:hypothetical protein